MKIATRFNSDVSDTNVSDTNHLENLSAANFYTRWRSNFILLLVLWVTATNALRGALQTKHFFDFQIFYDGAMRFSNGQPLYALGKFGESVYNQSPFPAMALSPLTRFSVEQASRMWTMLSILSIVASIGVFAHVLRLKWQDTVSGIVLIVTAFYFWPTLIDFSAGQINYILLFLLCVLYWCDTRPVATRPVATRPVATRPVATPQFPTASQSSNLQSDRKLKKEYSSWTSDWTSEFKRDMVIATVITLMAITKTWCIGLVLLYVLRKRLRVVGATVGLYALAMLALFFYVGFHQFDDFVAVTRQSSSQTWLVSYSISGFARLYFAENYLKINPIIDNIWLYRLIIVAGFLLVARGLWTIFRHGEPRSPLEARLQLGFVVSSILLLSPLCHMAYFQLCLPLLWTFLAASLVDEDTFVQSRAVTQWILIGVIMVYLLFTRPWPNFQALVNYQTFPRSLFIFVPFFANLALWFLTWKCLQNLRNDLLRSLRSERQSA